MYYAQINLGTRIVEGVTVSHSEIVADHMIEIIEEPYGEVLGKVHNLATGQFDVFVPPRKDVIQARLHEIDRLVDKPRTRREVMLGNAATIAWVESLDNEVETLRAEMANLT